VPHWAKVSVVVAVVVVAAVAGFAVYLVTRPADRGTATTASSSRSEPPVCEALRQDFDAVDRAIGRFEVPAASDAGAALPADVAAVQQVVNELRDALHRASADPRFDAARSSLDAATSDVADAASAAVRGEVSVATGALQRAVDDLTHARDQLQQVSVAQCR